MKTPRRSSALAIPLILALALALAACGGSSGSTSSTAAASVPASGASGPGGAGGGGSGRFAALRQCLAKQGITLPQRPAGTRPPGGGGLLGGGGFRAGGGAGAFANNPKLRAAMQKCGFTGGVRGGGGFRQRLSNPTVVAALNTFVTCMRSNGVNLPAANTSGTGPVFNTNGINTTSAAFKTAYAKCLPDLRGTFGRRAGATGAAGPAA